MSPSYELHSFHMNIGVGDGSLHILVDTAAKTKTGSCGTIQRTILIDSGKQKNGPVSCIESTMKKIMTDYDLPEGDGNLKLDAAIITHWDADHYKTLIFLLRKYKSDLETKKVQFLRYDKDGNPITVMYVPSWPSKMKKKDSEGPQQYLESELVEATGKTVMKVNPGGTESAHRGKWPAAFVLVEGTANLLGRDVLWNDDMDPFGWQQTIYSPQKLVAKVPPKFEGGPGVYCIAVNGVVLGQQRGVLNDVQVNCRSARKPPGVVDIVDGQSATKTGNPAYETNVVSICCMVIWKNSSSVRLSHFLGGDAVWNLEKIIMSWVGSERVAAMKISHHGSAGSTPLEMVDSFEPKTMVISSSTMYGHPSKTSPKRPPLRARTQL